MKHKLSEILSKKKEKHRKRVGTQTKIWGEIRIKKGGHMYCVLWIRYERNMKHFTYTQINK